MSRGYYRNSLTHWRDRLMRERRAIKARLVTMVRSNHPDANDQSILLDLNLKLLDVIETARRVADKFEELEQNANSNPSNG